MIVHHNMVISTQCETLLIIFPNLGPISVGQWLQLWSGYPLVLSRKLHAETFVFMIINKFSKVELTYINHFVLSRPSPIVPAGIIVQEVPASELSESATTPCASTCSRFDDPFTQGN